MALPVSLAEAKQHLRVTNSARDTEIGGFIADAAGWVEKYTGHILEARDVTEQFAGLKSVELRAWPIASNAIPGVAYVDAAGTAVPIVGARLDISRRPARIAPGIGHFWPFVDSQQPFAVTIRAGYEDPAAVPRNMRRAMLVLVSAYDSDREGGEIFQAAEKSARGLCRDFRLRRL